MVDYREILRLQSLGHNITQIAGALHSSRNTVREVERLADEKGIRWPLEEEVTNPQLYVLLYPERQEKANVYLEPDCAWIHRELAKKGVNLTLLWKEYQVNCSNAGRIPYQYTQFCDIYRAWAKKSKATMRIHHKPGDAMEVDWAGGTLPIKDPVTGEAVPAYVRMPDLLNEYAIAKSLNTQNKVKKAYTRFDLLIIDEWLLRPLPESEAYDLLELIDACSQKGALILCTQYDVDDWYYRIDCDRAEDEGSAVAEGILDRIINNKYSIEVKGRISMRKRHAFSNEESGVNNNG